MFVKGPQVYRIQETVSCISLHNILFWLFRCLVVKAVFGIQIILLRKTQFPGGAFILASNHSSHLDTVAILSVIPASVRIRICVVAAKDYFFNTIRFFWARYLFNLVPLDRRSGIQSLKKVVFDHTQNDGGLLIFPEGSRTRDGQIKSFKPGIGYVASMLNLPVVPVYICGGYKLMNAKSNIPARGKVTVCFGDVMRSNGEHPETFSSEIESEIRKLERGQYESIESNVHE